MRRSVVRGAGHGSWTQYRAILVALSLSLLSLVALASPAQANYATGGSGRFVDSINWFKWANINTGIPNTGVTQTNTVPFGSSSLDITCSLSNITDIRGGVTPPGPILVAYRPGAYGGDYLDDMYYSGGPGGANALDSGLISQEARTPQFDFSCSATFDGAPFPLTGLVMADAESTGQRESSSATIPASATWRIIDRGRQAGCTETSLTSRVGSTLTLGSTNECYPGAPASVAFMQGTSSATNVTIRGGGKQAIALGVMVAVDFGDAPASYGIAGNGVQPTFTGGNVPEGPATRVHDPAFTLAQVAVPSSHLGAKIDPENPAATGVGATGDDAVTDTVYGGGNDEDSITPPAPVVLQAGTPYTLPSVACSGPGFVAGWIDWNVNGTFDAGERSAPVECTGSSVAMTWTVPGGGVIPTTPTQSYLRLRIGPSLASMALPTGLLVSGETEDYALTLSVPKPVATNDTATTPKGAAVTLPIVANDTAGAATAPLDPTTVQLKDPADGLFKSTVTVPGVGTYTVNVTTGAVTFTPLATFTGATPPLTYRIADSNGSLATATIIVTVKPGPIANPDTDTTPQNVNITVDPAANDTPSPGGVPLIPSSVRIKDPVTGVYGTSVTIPGEGTYTVDPSSGKVTFDPLTGFTGAATPITYRITDTDGVTATSSIVITVTPIVPIALDNGAVTVVDTNVTLDVVANDAPGAATAPLNPTSVRLKDPVTGLFVTTVTIPDEGTYTVNPVTGKVTFDPLPAFFGPATPLTYQVADANGTTATAIITITVTPTAPAAAPDTNITPQGTPATTTILTNDTPGSTTFDLATVLLKDPVTGGFAKTVTIPGEGRYVVNPDGTVTFTPLPSFTGAATPITYQVKDASGGTATSTLAIIVTPVVPRAVNDAGATPLDTPVTIDLLANDTPGATSVPLDPTSVLLRDPATGTFSKSVTIPGEGTYTVDPVTGRVTFDPLPTFTGIATPMTYGVTDTNGTFATAKVTITVAGPPVVKPDVATTPQNVNITVDPLANDAPGASGGVPLDPTSVLLRDPATGTFSKSVTIPGEGTYTVDPVTGRVTFDPLTGFTGAATPIVYSVTATDRSTSSSTISITVTPIIPVAVKNTATTPVDTNVVIPLLANDTPGATSAPLDPTSVLLKDPATGTFGTTVAIPGEGTYTVDPVTGTLTFDPLPTFTGVGTPLTYQLADTNGTVTTTTVTVTVVPLSKPVGKPDVGTTKPGVPVTLNPLKNDTPTGGGKYIPDTLHLLDPKSGKPVDKIVVPGKGTWTVTDGKVTFTPIPGFHGTVLNRYTVQDTKGGKTTSTITVTVPTDTAPTEPVLFPFLPHTGAAIGAAALAGLVMIGLGGALLFRRRGERV
jgi:LPXTG-motif cell wall-anchored protein